MRVNRVRLGLAGLAVAALSFGLIGCSNGEDTIGGDVMAPVTMKVNDLQGASVDLVVGQVLNIDTESLAVDSYQAEVTPSGVVDFTQGETDGDAEMNPGFTGVKAGSAEVTMVNEQGGIQPLEFTITVTEK